VTRVPGRWEREPVCAQRKVKTAGKPRLRGRDSPQQKFENKALARGLDVRGGSGRDHYINISAFPSQDILTKGGFSLKLKGQPLTPDSSVSVSATIREKGKTLKEGEPTCCRGGLKRLLRICRGRGLASTQTAETRGGKSQLRCDGKTFVLGKYEVRSRFSVAGGKGGGEGF